jgi:anti-anti-sigma factor
MELDFLVKNGHLELNLKGRFTFADSKSFTKVLDDIAVKTYQKVIVDFAGVDFIDSAALGILLLTRERCNKTSTSLVLRHPKGQVKQMFDISRFTDLFKIEA